MKERMNESEKHGFNLFITGFHKIEIVQKGEIEGGGNMMGKFHCLKLLSMPL
jgi:hypothetical protein